MFWCSISVSSILQRTESYVEKDPQLKAIHLESLHLASCNLCIFVNGISGKSIIKTFNTIYRFQLKSVNGFDV